MQFAYHICIALFALLSVLFISASLVKWRFAVAVTRQTSTVYGFQGAISALGQGQILHYNVNLDACKLQSGSDEELEFAEPFGGQVDHYRSINEKEPEQITNLVFYQQKLVYNSTGRLAQLSREITVWENNTVTIRSLLFTPDFSSLTNMYEHLCTMESTNLTLADVSLRVSGSPTHLFKFEDIYQALKAGQGVTFSAISFLCAGGRETSYSGLGGHIPSNCAYYNDTCVKRPLKIDKAKILMTNDYDAISNNLIESTFGPTAHYDEKAATSMVDSLNVRIYNNRTVEIIDIRGRPPSFHVVSEHELHCFLQTGMPGGTVNVFAVY